jgi:DNA-directed RNA polymerase subunit RPC12/RpoP
VDIPRQKLVELVSRFGPQVSEDAKRCEGLLRDFCGDHKREITILVAAIREGVTVELRVSQGAIPQDVLLERCSQRLHSNLGLVPHLARWSVETWALALGVISTKELTNLFQCPSCGTSGNSATPIAGKSIKCPKCKSRIRVSDDGRQFALKTKRIADAASTTKTVSVSQPHDGLADPFAQPPNDPLEQLLSALRQIMADGVITDAEKSQIQQLRESLGVSQDDAQRLFAQIKAELALRTPSASILPTPSTPLDESQLLPPAIAPQPIMPQDASNVATNETNSSFSILLVISVLLIGETVRRTAEVEGISFGLIIWTAMCLFFGTFTGSLARTDPGGHQSGPILMLGLPLLGLISASAGKDSIWASGWFYWIASIGLFFVAGGISGSNKTAPETTQV